jgi:hypothetical protein
MTTLLCLLSLLLMQQPARTEVGTINGQLRASTGMPVPFLRVFAIPIEADAADTLTSISRADGDGRYRLEGVPPGRYLIGAGALDSPTYYPGVATRSQGQIVTIAAEQAIVNLDFTIVFPSPPPQLWGKVEFDDGSPLPVGTLKGIQLILSSASAHWTTRPFTNQQGVFFFQSVVPGEHTVTFAPLPLSFGFYLKSMTFGNVDLTRAPLTLTEALTTTEIKVVLTKTRPAGIPSGVKVSGRVTHQVPLVLSALTRVIDQVHPEDVPNAVATMTPREDGSFEVQGVPPGRYLLGTGAKGLMTVDVAGSDVTNLELNVPAAGQSVAGLRILLSPTSMRSITGTVEVGTGTVPKFELEFSTTRADRPAPKVVISGKEFSISVPEAEYRINISGLPNGYTVESVTAGPLDLTYPFLVTSKGIADRFTGNPILIRSAGQTSAISAGITVRLKAPPSEK